VCFFATTSLCGAIFTSSAGVKKRRRKVERRVLPLNNRGRCGIRSSGAADAGSESLGLLRRRKRVFGGGGIL